MCLEDSLLLVSSHIYVHESVILLFFMLSKVTVSDKVDVILQESNFQKNYLERMVSLAQ